jgi:hypothetical protein
MATETRNELDSDVPESMGKDAAGPFLGMLACNVILLLIFVA